MATAKVKIFVGVEPDKLESDINDWLGRLPAPGSGATELGVLMEPGAGHVPQP
jgi:hypothetical protein